MTPSPENNEAGRLLDMEDEQNALRAEADKLRAELEQSHGQLTNAIDERNIARKESTALAGQLAAVTKERDEERARLADETAIVDRIWAILGRPSYEALNGKSIYDLIEALRQRGAELETACSGARQALLRDDLTETFIILDKALAATAPDAQSTPPNP